jgi:IPTL-CTERM motif
VLYTSLLRKLAVGFGFLLVALSWVPASAVTTVNLSSSTTAIAGSPSVYTVTQTLVLPAGFTNASLSIANLNIDDRGILQLNGVTVDSAGIFGPGTTTLDLTPSGPTITQSYAANGPRSVIVTTGFVAGTNSLTILVNDTNNGINGSPLPGGVNISGTSIGATLQYDVLVAASPTAIPTLSEWAMLILMLGLAALGMRRIRGR